MFGSYVAYKKTSRKWKVTIAIRSSFNCMNEINDVIFFTNKSISTYISSTFTINQVIFSRHYNYYILEVFFSEFFYYIYPIYYWNIFINNDYIWLNCSYFP